MSDHKAPRWSFQAIARNLRDQIIDGRLPPAAALPSLNAIRAERNVSYQTAQEAIKLLKVWGLVKTTQGSGTFVSTERPIINLMTEMTLPGPDGRRRTWKQICADQGKVGTQRVLGAGWRPAPPEVADAFDYEAGTEVGWRERLLLSDDVPVQIATSYYPPALVQAIPALVLPAKLPTNSMQLAAGSEWEIAKGRGRDTFSGRWPTEAEAAVLAIETDQAISEVFRVGRNTDGVVVVVERMVTNPVLLRQAWDF